MWTSVGPELERLVYDDWLLSTIVGLGESDYEQSLGWNRLQMVQNMFLEAKWWLLFKVTIIWELNGM